MFLNNFIFFYWDKITTTANLIRFGRKNKSEKINDQKFDISGVAEREGKVQKKIIKKQKAFTAPCSQLEKPFFFIFWEKSSPASKPASVLLQEQLRARNS